MSGHGLAVEKDRIGEVMSKIESTYGPELTQIQAASLDNLVKEVQGTLGVITLPNLEQIDDPLTVPSGTVICVSKDGQLEVSVIPENLFSLMAVYPILESKSGADLDDDYFRHRMSTELGSKIASKFGAGPSVKNMNTGIGAPLGSDMKKWAPFLGGGFWSINKYEKQMYSGQYYVSVYVPRTQLSTEFVEAARVMAQQDALNPSSQCSTFNDVFTMPTYSRAEQLAKRNVNKIAWKVATAFDVYIKHRIDNDAPDSKKTLTKPLTAVPSHFSIYNHLETVKLSLDDNSPLVEAIAIYKGCGSINSSVGGFVAPVSPRLGVDFFPDIRRVAGFLHNQTINAIPLGRSLIGSADLNQPDLKFNENHVYWEGKKGRAVHPKMKQVYNVASENEINPFLPSGEKEKRMRLAHLLLYLGKD